MCVTKVHLVVVASIYALPCFTPNALTSSLKSGCTIFADAEKMCVFQGGPLFQGTHSGLVPQQVQSVTHCVYPLERNVNYDKKAFCYICCQGER